eukprot:6543601-Karenia_brevis.AAC.1
MSRVEKKQGRDDVLFKEKVYVRGRRQFVDKWFAKLVKEKVKPNSEQLAYLHELSDRCLQEASELQTLAASTKKRGT